MFGKYANSPGAKVVVVILVVTVPLVVFAGTLAVVVDVSATSRVLYIYCCHRSAILSMYQKVHQYFLKSTSGVWNFTTVRHSLSSAVKLYYAENSNPPFTYT